MLVCRFLQGFFKNASEGYKTYNSSADIFTIPATYDLAICNFQKATVRLLLHPPS